MRREPVRWARTLPSHMCAAFCERGAVIHARTTTVPTEVVMRRFWETQACGYRAERVLKAAGGPPRGAVWRFTSQIMAAG